MTNRSVQKKLVVLLEITVWRQFYFLSQKCFKTFLFMTLPIWFCELILSVSTALAFGCSNLPCWEGKSSFHWQLRCLWIYSWNGQLTCEIVNGIQRVQETHQMSLFADLPDNWALRAGKLQARKVVWSLWSVACQCIALLLGFDCLLNYVRLYEIARLFIFFSWNRSSFIITWY